jgi:hypothetical protein
VRNPLIKAEAANDFSLIGLCLSSVDLSKNKKREQGADDGEQSLAVQHPGRTEAVVDPAVSNPIKYQRRAVSVRSATGPQRNRQRFAETPTAPMDAAIATEKPARTRTKGRVMEIKPLLTPYGSTRKKKMTGAVDPGLRTVLFKGVKRARLRTRSPNTSKIRDRLFLPRQNS